MLRDAHSAGVVAALATFRIKKADFVGGMKALGRGLVGNPLQVAREGTRAFAPGGALHWSQVLWPSAPGQPVQNALGRAATALSALPVVSALGGGGDPNEGRLSNLLGAAGGALGSAYGFPAVGMLGAPLVARAGASIGRGLGHLLGSRPRPPALPAPPTYPAAPY